MGIIDDIVALVTGKHKSPVNNAINSAQSQTQSKQQLGWKDAPGGGYLPVFNTDSNPKPQYKYQPSANRPDVVQAQQQVQYPQTSGDKDKVNLFDTSKYKGNSKDVVPTPRSDIAKLISTYFKGDEGRAAATQYFENRGGKPDLIGPPNKDGSRDYGLWQINDNTFKGFLDTPAYQPYLQARGITSVKDLLDPVKNTQVAYLKTLENRKAGVNPWGGWYGWRDNGYNLGS